MLSIGKYINYQLSGITGVKSVTPLVTVSGNSTFIVYKRTSEVPEYTNEGLAYNKTSVQIDIMSNDYYNCVSIAELVRKKLENISIKYGNYIIRDCVLSTASEDTDGNFYIETLNFDFITT